MIILQYNGDMTPEQSETLTRVDERTKNTKESLDNHIEDDHDRFERTFSFVKEAFGKVDKRLETIDRSIGDLRDWKNQKEGAFGFGKWVAGGIGGITVAFIDFLLNNHGGDRP